MKESGDKGKMCFCEQDYCNAAQSINSNLKQIGFEYLINNLWQTILVLIVAVSYASLHLSAPVGSTLVNTHANDLDQSQGRCRQRVEATTS